MFAILLGGVARRRLVPLALHLRNEAQHRVVAEYVVAARADKNLCLGKTEKKKKSKHYFCCCHCSVVQRRGKPESVPSEEIVSFSTLLQLLLLGENPGEVDTVWVLI